MHAGKPCGALFCSVCLLAGIARAKEVVWSGAVNANWDTATENWQAGGAPATFAVRDDARFTDDAVGKSVTAASLAVGRIVFSNDAAYVLNGGGTV